MDAAMEMTYHEGPDGMLYPDIRQAGEQKVSLGKYGLMAMDYLRENHRERFRSLQRFGRLAEVLAPVEDEANRMQESLVESYLKSHKPEDPDSTMEMWEIREQGQRMAEEIVLTEIVNKYH